MVSARHAPSVFVIELDWQSNPRSLNLAKGVSVNSRLSLFVKPHF